MLTLFSVHGTELHVRLWFFFFNDTATTEIYTLSLHDALPICQPPARLFAMICLNMAPSARLLIGSPRRKATVRPVLLSWPAVMMPSGSGTIAPSYRKMLTWSFAARN